MHCVSPQCKFRVAAFASTFVCHSMSLALIALALSALAPGAPPLCGGLQACHGFATDQPKVSVIKDNNVLLKFFNNMKRQMIKLAHAPGATRTSRSPHHPGHAPHGRLAPRAGWELRGLRSARHPTCPPGGGGARVLCVSRCGPVLQVNSASLNRRDARVVRRHDGSAPARLRARYGDGVPTRARYAACRVEYRRGRATQYVDDLPRVHAPRVENGQQGIAGVAVLGVFVPFL